jgi:hypothetical protein
MSKVGRGFALYILVNTNIELSGLAQQLPSSQVATTEKATATTHRILTHSKTNLPKSAQFHTTFQGRLA